MQPLLENAIEMSAKARLFRSGLNVLIGANPFHL